MHVKLIILSNVDRESFADSKLNGPVPVHRGRGLDGLPARSPRRPRLR
jgi:hypothetical protein